jgi:hypothetical protein
MNIFLFAPGLAVVLWRQFGLLGAGRRIALCALVQVDQARVFFLVFSAR